MRKALAVLVALCVCGAWAEERTVSTAADLVAALEALNSKTAPAEPNVIYLEPGSYDVSAYSMEDWGSSGKKATSSKHIVLTNCLIGSGRQAVAVPEWEVNTVTSDVPCFVKGEGRDYYALKHSSPARGKGLVMDWMTDATDIRQDEAYPRLRDGKVDIGCYQCWLDAIGLKFRIW